MLSGKGHVQASTVNGAISAKSTYGFWHGEYSIHNQRSFDPPNLRRSKMDGGKWKD